MYAVLNKDKKAYIFTNRKENTMDNVKRFDIAAGTLSKRLSEIFLAMEKTEKNRIREIRIRSRRPLTVITDKGAEFLTQSGRLTQIYSDLTVKTDENEVAEIFRRLCGYSVHSFADAINRGYITINGGHRAGIAGTAVTENGRVTAVRDICAVNLRIAREIKGAADDVMKMLFSEGLCSVIIAGPPSSGKTTVLRDLARRLSSSEGSYRKTFICDERGEIGASFSGIEQNDIGLNSDLITSYPKAEGIMIGLRSFSPDIIICDEVSTYEEATAVISGVNSGVSFALSIHARNEKELKSRAVLKMLLETGEFQKIVLLSGSRVGKTEKIFGAGDLIA